MEWARFHHPDISLPVIRRRGTEELLDLLADLGDLVLTRDWPVLLGSTFPSQGAYHSAMYRLRKKGLVAYRREGGRNPVLRLTEEGAARRPESYHPDRYWERKWDKRWYVLIYDIPETERRYRSALRGFLRRMRMGCLQKSVWVTPHDIRPEFDDLAKAGGLGGFAYLLEAQTVLGQHPDEIVNDAWDFDRLADLQAEYIRVAEANLCRLRGDSFAGDALVKLARDDGSGYLQVMRDDPLLPRALWPSHYRGPDVLQAHREIGKEIRSQLQRPDFPCR